MSNITLSIEQMNTLRELGLDVRYTKLYQWKERHGDTVISDGNVDEMQMASPVYTLQEILEILERVKYKSAGFPFLLFDYNYSFGHWKLAFRNPDVFSAPIIKEKTPLEAAYKMLVWCIENGYIKTK